MKEREKESERGRERKDCKEVSDEWIAWNNVTSLNRKKKVSPLFPSPSLPSECAEKRERIEGDGNTFFLLLLLLLLDGRWKGLLIHFKCDVYQEQLFGKSKINWKKEGKKMWSDEKWKIEYRNARRCLMD